VITRPTGVVSAAPVGSPEQLRDWIELTTIGDLLVRAATLRPDADAVVFPEQRQTYGEVLASAEAFARSLAALGVERGETVAVLMPNCPEYVHTLFACAMLGVRALLVNARYKEHELAYVLHNADAVAIVTTDLIDYCRGTIAAFKVPRHVRFVTEWPMSATKIQKHRLREELLRELGLA
jgi:acyl-CoA synthetase (AMP-forming)/AMP-acid ligase II